MPDPVFVGKDVVEVSVVFVGAAARAEGRKPSRRTPVLRRQSGSKNAELADGLYRGGDLTEGFSGSLPVGACAIHQDLGREVLAAGNLGLVPAGLVEAEVSLACGARPHCSRSRKDE